MHDAKRIAGLQRIVCWQECAFWYADYQGLAALTAHLQAGTKNEQPLVRRCGTWEVLSPPLAKSLERTAAMNEMESRAGGNGMESGGDGNDTRRGKGPSDDWRACSEERGARRCEGLLDWVAIRLAQPLPPGEGVYSHFG